MQFKEISIEDIEQLVDPSYLSIFPLHQHPQFLRLSASYLQKNSHLLEKAGFESPKISPYYLWIKDEDNTTLGFIPILQINSQTRTLSLIPSRKLQESFLPITKSRMNLKSLSEELKKRGYFIQFQLNLTGWNLTSSLFSIFRWFPERERKQIINEKDSIELKEVSYIEGQKVLENFYLYHWGKIKKFTMVFKKDTNLFQKFFPKNYRLILVYNEQKIIGAISFVDYLQKIYFLDFLGNSIFNRNYPKILFDFFKWAKEQNTKSVYTAFFEWCLTPFYLDKLIKNKEELSYFMKKAVQMKNRNLKEIDV